MTAVAGVGCLRPGVVEPAAWRRARCPARARRLPRRLSDSRPLGWGASSGPTRWPSPSRKVLRVRQNLPSEAALEVGWVEEASLLMRAVEAGGFCRRRRLVSRAAVADLMSRGQLYRRGRAGAEPCLLPSQVADGVGLQHRLSLLEA